METHPVPSPGGHRGWWAWTAVNAGYAALLIVVAVMPTNPVTGLAVSDFTAHAAGYGVQAVLLFGMVASRRGTGVATMAAMVGAIGFGAFTELLQLLQPARAVDMADIVADSVGVVVAMLALVVVRRVVRGSAEVS